MFEEVSSQKQIIFTTHNPEVVRHVGLNNLLLVARDANGFSSVSRPEQRETVKVFLQNELGVTTCMSKPPWLLMGGFRQLYIWVEGPDDHHGSSRQSSCRDSRSTIMWRFTRIALSLLTSCRRFVRSIHSMDAELVVCRP